MATKRNRDQKIKTKTATSHSSRYWKLYSNVMHLARNRILRRHFQATPWPFLIAFNNDISNRQNEDFYFRYVLKNILLHKKQEIKSREWRKVTFSRNWITDDALTETMWRNTQNFKSFLTSRFRSLWRADGPHRFPRHFPFNLSCFP